MGKAMVERGSRFVRVLFIALIGIILIVPSLANGSEGITFESDPILVEGNGGFTAAGFTGSGTAEDPYLLKDLSLDANLELHGIRISNTTAHFRIEGCTVHDAYSPDRDPLNLSASGSGILLINVTNAVIEDYLGDFNIRGITIVGSSNVIVNDSRFNNNIEAGVHLMECLDGNVMITNSTFTVGSGDDGILIERCNEVLVSGNMLQGGRNGVVVKAGGLGLGSNAITDNELSGQTLNGILLGGSVPTEGDLVLNNSIHGVEASAVMIESGTSGDVRGNEISGCAQGIFVAWSGNQVLDNTLSNNTQGVVIGTGADSNTVSGNRISDGNLGVWIRASQGNAVLGNTILRIDEESAAGIYLGTGEVRDSRIEGNIISHCYEGIRAAPISGQEISGLLLANNSVDGSIANGTYLLRTTGSRLINNSFSSGGGSGVYLGAGCHDLVLDGNEASSNQGAGLYVRDADDNVVTSNLLFSNIREGVYLERGSGNLIHGNALLFNKDSGRQYSALRPQAYCGEGGNNWSLGTGNLWADWLSPDDNDDGIVDLPYNLSGGFQDPFPLTSISGLEIPADVTPPEVIAYAPQGLGAEKDETVAITFSEDMNTSSVMVTINDILMNGAWNDRTLELDIQLEFETEYSVEVNGRDLAGNNMTEFSWTFRTEGPNATVSGRVIDEDGNALVGVRVILGNVEDITGDDGRFSLEVAPGNYSFEFWKDDYTARPLSIQVLPGEDQDVGDVEMVYDKEGGISGTSPYVGLILLALAILVVAGFAVIYLRRRKN